MRAPFSDAARNRALPAIRAFENGETARAKNLAEQLLAGSTDPSDALTRYCTRAILAADLETDRDPHRDTDVAALDALRSELRSPARAWRSWQTEYRLGIRLHDAELNEGALPLFEEVVRRLEQLPPKRTNDLALKSARAYLAQCLGFVGRQADAVPLQRQVCQDEEERQGPLASATISSLRDLGIWLSDTGEHKEALSVLGEAKERALLAPHGTELLGLIELAEGTVRMRLADWPGAIEAFDRALPQLQKDYGPTSEIVGVCCEGRQDAERALSS